jgi:hypothetical protein
MPGKKRKSVDVRSQKDIKDLERDIKIGPITIVLIYADWCGHCTRFKEDVWKKLTSKPSKVNLASIHHDQLTNTSLRDAKIRGYPSVLVVGRDGKPAVFKDEGEPTNAMPQPDYETLEKIVSSDPGNVMKTTEEKEEDPTEMMAPPDVRRNVMRGGNLLRLLSSYARGKTMKHKRNSGKKTRRS